MQKFSPLKTHRLHVIPCVPSGKQLKEKARHRSTNVRGLEPVCGCVAGMLSPEPGALGFDVRICSVGPAPLQQTDSSWDRSRAGNPEEFSNSCSWRFRGVWHQSNSSVPCGLCSHPGFQLVHPETSPPRKAAGDGDQVIPPNARRPELGRRRVPPHQNPGPACCRAPSTPAPPKDRTSVVPRRRRHPAERAVGQLRGNAAV